MRYVYTCMMSWDDIGYDQMSIKIFAPYATITLRFSEKYLFSLILALWKMFSLAFFGKFMPHFEQRLVPRMPRNLGSDNYFALFGHMAIVKKDVDFLASCLPFSTRFCTGFVNLNTKRTIQQCSIKWQREFERLNLLL